MRRHGLHPYLAHDGPIAFAHRGGAREAPENTLPAFEAALALGYRYLETDAQLTRDGVLVAFHDDRLDRVTDRAGALAELDMAAVGAADAGHSFSPDGGHSHPYRGRGVTIPRLQELLSRWPHVRFNIDVKSDSTVAPLVELLDRFDAWERVCLGTMPGRRARHIRALAGGRACVTMDSASLSLARLTTLFGVVRRGEADCVQMSLGEGATPILTARLIGACHRAGVPVHAWTVDREQVMHELLDLGVDGIMTDRPELLRSVFSARGLDVGGAPPARSRR